MELAVDMLAICRDKTPDVACWVILTSALVVRGQACRPPRAEIGEELHAGTAKVLTVACDRGRAGLAGIDEDRKVEHLFARGA
jgi:hypothetical protein